MPNNDRENPVLNLERLLKPLLLAILALAVVGGGTLFYRMVDQMERMTALMGEMSSEIKVVTREMTAMRASMERMEGHVGQMGQGVEKMERINPMRMFPGGQ